MNKLLRIEPRSEGSDEMVLIVPPELAEKLKSAKFYPEYQSGELTYHVVSTGRPIDTKQEDVSDEEIQKYVSENVDLYWNMEDDNGESFRDTFKDHPFPFHDFPAPINEHIAKTEIRKFNEMVNDEFDDDDDDDYIFYQPIPDIEAESKAEAVMYHKSFEDAVLSDPHLVFDIDEQLFETEKAIITELATQCNLPTWKIIFYLKVYDKFVLNASI